MNLVNFSPLWFFAGAGAIALVLLALQSLRVRYTVVPVHTVMFWQAAAREAPAKVFHQRLRHLLSYLLFLLIAVLLWFAIGKPELSASDPQGHVVLFLDASAHNAGGDDFKRSLAKLKEDISAFSDDRREVIWGGAFNQKLLAPGESKELLDVRLQGLEREEVPSSLEAQLQLFNRTMSTRDETLRVMVYGRAPVSSQLLSQLDKNIVVERAQAMPTPGENIGIVTLGYRMAVSGDQDKVDVLIDVAGSPSAMLSLDDIKVTLDEQPIDINGAVTGDSQIRLADLPAFGGLLAVGIGTPDWLMADNTARLRLPVVAPIRVQVSQDTPPVIRSALSADNGVVLVEDNADVLIQNLSGDSSPDLPVLALVPTSEQSSAFEVHLNQLSVTEDDFKQSIAEIGILDIDATGLASETGKIISVDVRSSEQRQLHLWRELISSDYNFTKSAMFPVFISSAIRWLHGQQQWFPYVPSGQILSESVYRFGEKSFDGANTSTDFFIEKTGEFRLPYDNNTVVEASLLDFGVSTGVTEDTLKLNASEFPVVSSNTNLVTWIISIVLMLLLIEWILYQRRLIP